MKYLSKRQILESLQHIALLNQFFGLTYLAAKAALMPVGKVTEISLDKLNDLFLQEYYRLDPRSKHFFRVFRYNYASKFWLNPDYSGKGLQKLNTTTFAPAFIHSRKSKEWGWREDYLEFLVTKLPHETRIPAFHLATWLYRGRSWKDVAKRETVIERFYDEFHITPDEKAMLFTSSVATLVSDVEAFQDAPVSWQEIVEQFGQPPDVGPEAGGILSYLEINGVGPVPTLSFEPGQRLNIVTGDNGLGKSFLLDVAWFVLTNKWAGYRAMPTAKRGMRAKAKIKFKISGSLSSKPQSIEFRPDQNNWSRIPRRATIPGLAIYARVDGSYAVWDPAIQTSEDAEEAILVLNRDEVWNGNNRIEGLIRDWTKWQDNPQKYPFDTFLKVLKCMGPPDMGDLEPGDPVRLAPDPRDFPTIRHSYGEIPLIHESAGIRHIITLAYLMVWSWNEHLIRSHQFGRKPENRMVVLIDEMEVHLHPRWQRVILPAILSVARLLSSSLEMQLVIATHSPLVLASAEAVFDQSTDKLFHLEQSKAGRISFCEKPFLVYGEIGSWLTSDLFELKHARSKEAESAISRAIGLQTQDDPSEEEIREVSGSLADLLPPEDQFWPRWVFFAKSHGVDI